MHRLLSLLLLVGCLPGEEGRLVPLTVVDDPALPRFETADGRLLHLRAFGPEDGDVLVMLHGGPGGDHRGYLHFEQAFPDHRVILYDQRGSGLSERVPDEELDGPHLAAELDQIATAFSPDAPIVLMGHSWGGALAAYYVEAHPDRVSKLILVEPGALHADAAAAGNVVALDFLGPRVQDYLQATEHLEPESHAEADYFYVLALSGFGDREDEGLLSYPFWRLGYRANVAINTWQGNFDGSRTFDATDGIDVYTGQTLFITGETDGRLGHRFQIEQHVPFFAAPEVVQVPGVGHADLLREASTLDAIREFLR